ncbi:hypothetical protein Taro_014731 [Colocasia esculenta]|uniref:Uncharacterized protein n=1 Tax=Colocasia esculenta TaxID=4460 RepID=A0A843UJI3_COLES|nr:hypothetical protein [Colocasia esculenta]
MTPATDSDKLTQVYLSVSQPRTKGPAAAPREKDKKLWRPTKHHHLRTTRSDDTDLDGTAQVPGQSPELTAWLTENLGHPTGEVTTVGVYYLTRTQKPRAHRTNHVKSHVNLVY